MSFQKKNQSNSCLRYWTRNPDAIKEKIFKALFTTKSKSQGFGLAIVKKLTEGLGGDISFETKLGRGTTLIIELPMSHSGLA